MNTVEKPGVGTHERSGVGTLDMPSVDTLTAHPDFAVLVSDH